MSLSVRAEGEATPHEVVRSYMQQRNVMLCFQLAIATVLLYDTGTCTGQPLFESFHIQDFLVHQFDREVRQGVSRIVNSFDDRHRQLYQVKYFWVSKPLRYWMMPEPGPT